MSDSLLLGGIIELLGRVPSTQPQCSGATFMLAPNFDLNAPQPTSDIVASLMVDGQRPFGNRSSNRTVTLPVIITGPDRATVASAVELLLQTINQQVWQTTWTRDGGNPAVYDCFRATPTVMTYNLLQQYDSQPLQALTISFPALPFVRADEATVVTFSSPAQGSMAPPGPVELDNYSTVQGQGWSQAGVFNTNPLLAGGNMSGWVGFQGTLTTVNTQPAGGPTPWALKFVNTGPSTFGNLSEDGAPFAAQLNTGYTVTAWVYSPNGAVEIGFNWRLNGAFVTSVKNTITVPSNTWTKVSTTITSPSSGINQGEAVIDGNSGAAYTMYAAQILCTLAIPGGGAQYVNDLNSAHWNSGGGGYPTYAVAIPATDISQMAAITAWIGLGATVAGYPTWHGGPVTVSLTLTDANGNQLMLGETMLCAASESTVAPVWQQFTMLLPGGAETFDFAHVTGYALSAWAFQQDGALTLPADLYLNGLTGVPSSVSVAASTRAWLASLPAIQGSAHAPISLQLQLPGSGQVVSQFNTAGSFSVVIPANVLTADVKLWGGGGGGKSEATAGQGGGASGGGFAWEPALPVTAGTLTGTVGAGGAAGANGGDTTFASSAVKASGGLGATSSTGAAPNDTSANTHHYPGGAGASGTATAGAASRRQVVTKAVTIDNATLNFPSNVLPGSCLIAWIGAYGSTGDATVSSITIGGSEDNWEQVVSAGRLFGWIDPNCGVSGQNRVTVQLDGGSGQQAIVIAVEEWINVNPAAPLDTSSGNPSNASTSYTSDPAATSQANEVWSGAAVAIGSPVTYEEAKPGGQVKTINKVTLFDPGAPWTNLNNPQQITPNDTKLLLMVNSSHVVSALGTANYSGTVGSSDRTNAAVIALVANSPAYSGGGGSSAGTGGAGHAAVGPNGGAPPTGGAAGGAGTTAQGPGTPGASPGAGGAGALSTGTSENGGAGANGQAIVTYQVQGLAQFSNFVAHIPGTGAPAALVPYVSVGNGLDTPNGLTEYPVAGPAPGVNARFGGTYTVLAVAKTFNNPTAPRTLTVAIKEYEALAGLSDTTTLSRTFTPDTTGAVDLTTGLNGYVVLGTVTLPKRFIPADNTASLFTVTVTDSNTSDFWYDVLFLDVSGQTVLVNMSGSGYSSYFLDSPDASADIGPVLGSQSDRSQAWSVLANAIVSGGPLYVDPGANTLMVYSTAGAPSLLAAYRPQFWRPDRLMATLKALTSKVSQLHQRLDRLINQLFGSGPGSGLVVGPWQNFSLQNGWGNSGSGPNGQYRLIGSPPNEVEVIGDLSAGTITVNTLVATLPVGFRPNTSQIIIPSYPSATSAPTNICPHLLVGPGGQITVIALGGLAPAGTRVSFHEFLSLDA